MIHLVVVQYDLETCVRVPLSANDYRVSRQFQPNPNTLLSGLSHIAHGPKHSKEIQQRQCGFLLTMPQCLEVACRTLRLD